jgi:hypothetical protein
LPFVPANLLPSSFKIGSSLRAVRSTIEIDSSRMLKGMSLTGDFYWLIYRWRSLWFISLWLFFFESSSVSSSSNRLRLANSSLNFILFA